MLHHIVFQIYKITRVFRNLETRNFGNIRGDSRLANGDCLWRVFPRGSVNEGWRERRYRVKGKSRYRRPVEPENSIAISQRGILISRGQSGNMIEQKWKIFNTGKFSQLSRCVFAEHLEQPALSNCKCKWRKFAIGKTIRLIIVLHSRMDILYTIAWIFTTLNDLHRISRFDIPLWISHRTFIKYSSPEDMFNIAYYL